MIINLLVLLLTGFIAYYSYTKFVAEKLDSPQNNPAVKGLEKAEIKAAVKEGEAKIKEFKEEIKAIEKERKDILEGSDADKGDKAKEKLESKEAKLVELKEMETNLVDLKIVDKGEYWAMMPNKMSLTNGLWIGGFIIIVGVIYKLLIGIVGYVWHSVFPQ